MRNPEQMVAENFRYLGRRIDRLSSAPIGPVTIDDPDSFIVFADPTTGAPLISISPLDVRVPHGGSMTSLSPLLESKASDADLQAERQARYTADQSTYNNAYTASKTYADGIESRSKVYAKGLVDSEATTRYNADQSTYSAALTAAKGYTDTTATSTLTAAAADAKSKVDAEASVRYTADQSTYNNAYSDAKTYANGVETRATAYTNSKVSAEATTRYNADQSTYNNAYSDAKTYANGVESRAKSYAATGDKDLANNQIAPLIARVNGHDSKLADLQNQINQLKNRGGSTL